MAVLLCAAAALLPALILPGLLFYFDVTPKLLVLLVCVIAALAATPFARWRIGSGLGAFMARGPGRHLAFALTAYSASVALSTLLSTHAALSCFGSTWRRFGVLTQLALIAFALLAAAELRARTGMMRGLLQSVTASGALIAAYVIAQYLGWDPLLASAAYRAGEGAFEIVRPPGTLGHADYAASYLLFVIFAAWALRTMETSRVQRFAALLAALTAVAALLLTGSRSGLLGLLAGLAMSVRGRPTRAHVAAFASCVALTAILYVSPAGARLRARVHWAFDEPAGGGRPLLWRDAIRMTASHWALGFGPETFGAEFPRYQSLELTRLYPDVMHESPHNAFLDVLVAQGALGLAAFAALCVLGCYWSWRARGAASRLGAAFVAMLVSVQFTSFTLPVAFFFFLALAALAADAASAPAESRDAGEEPRWRWAAFFAALTAAAFLAWYGTRLAVGDYELAAFKRALARRDASSALRHYAAAQRVQLSGASAELYCSRRLLEYSAHERDPLRAAEAGGEAFVAGVRACQDPEQRPNAFYNLAMLFAARDNVANTERSLREAIMAAPRWFKPRWTLAQVLAMTSRLDEAERQAAAAVERDGGHDPEVRVTLDKIRAVIASRKPAR